MESALTRRGFLFIYLCFCRNRNIGAFISISMADSDILAAVKTMLQDQFEGQSLTIHQTLQQYMATVDSRLEDFRSQFQHLSFQSMGPFVPSASMGSFVPPPFMGPSVPPPAFSAPADFSPGGSDNTPVLRSMKIEVPKFDGSDPNVWIFRVQEFFDFHATPNPLRLRIVAFHMEGKAATWFQWMKASKPISSWTDFLSNLRQRFGASPYENYQGPLSKLTQTLFGGRISDSIRGFEE